MPTTYEDIKESASAVIRYMEQDWESYEAVFNNPSLCGKLGIGLVSNASAALDFFAWLISDQSGVNARFRDMIEHPGMFFGDPVFFPYDLVYLISRCGVVHQFFPKKFMTIAAINSPEPFLEIGGIKCINAMGFYFTSLNGLRLIRDAIHAESNAITQQKMIDRLDARIAEEVSFDAVIAAYPWPAHSAITPSLTSFAP